MPLVAVTRLRTRSARFVLPFGWYTWCSFRQAKHAPGSLGVKLRKAEGLAFWTLTSWQDEAAMSAYRITPPIGKRCPSFSNGVMRLRSCIGTKNPGTAGLENSEEANGGIWAPVQSESSVGRSTSRASGPYWQEPLAKHCA